MRNNIGTLDRILRVVVGIALILFVFIGPKTSWGRIGLIPLVTAAVGFCFITSPDAATTSFPGRHRTEVSALTPKQTKQRGRKDFAFVPNADL